MQPWATGSAEILEHGLLLLNQDNDQNRRLAMIAIDNAVELMIKTYLGLPRRVTGLSISRKEYQEISESFPRLLDALESHCADRINGVELGEVEWYHRLRNQLYHQGNGLTVEREKVRVYAELARILFKNLFGAEIEQKDSSADLFGLFMNIWVRLEKAISRIARDHRSDLTVTGQRVPPPMVVLPALQELGIVTRKQQVRLEYFRAVRNALVHGQTDPERALNKRNVDELERIVESIEKHGET